MNTRSLLIMTALLAAITSHVAALTVSPPPTAADAAGAWTGFAAASEFLRLELDISGSGYLAIKYLPDAPPRLYRVERWRIADSRIHLQIRPIDSDAEPISFRGMTYSWTALEGEIVGRRWSRGFRLYSEREWTSRSVPLHDRIAHYRRIRTR
jgi:hypothetical protein